VRGPLIALACVAAAILYAWLDRDTGIRNWLELRAEVAAVEQRIAELRAEIDTLEAEIASFEETTPFAVERAIREELDWVRPGEILVRMRRSRELGARFLDEPTPGEDVEAE
jgi:cell division protein FtsB